MTVPETPSVLINTTINEFKAEGYSNTNLQVIGANNSKKVVLTFLKVVEEETEEVENG